MELRILPYPLLEIKSLAVWRNDLMLIGAIGGNGYGLFQIYNLKNDQKQDVNKESTFSVAFFPKGDYIIQGSLNKNLTNFNYADQNDQTTINTTWNATNIKVSSNGEYISA